MPKRLREIAPLVTGAPSVKRAVKLGFKMSLRRGFDFVVNGERHHHDQPVKVGELQVWDAVNTSSIDVALVNGIFNLNPFREGVFRDLGRVVRSGGHAFGAELILQSALPTSL